MTKPISSEKYLRGAGLALKAGERGEAAEFFLKGGEFETAALLLKEARAAAALNHPNIITIHDVGLDGGQGYIAMELVEGESYARMLQRRGRLDLAEVMHFLVSVCQGLDHAHRRGVIHRDIKPSNILLTVEDRVKIVDFGLAQSARASTKQPVGGTIKYIAPEQARGHQTDARTDIYSLGATLYELITGATPFTTGNIVKHHLETPAPPLTPEGSVVPPALDELVLKCLAKEPDARFATTREMIAFVQSENLLELCAEMITKL